MSADSFYQRNEPITDLVKLDVPGRSQSEINVKINLGRDVYIPMKVRNVSEKNVAWRFRINTRGRYMVKPRRQGCLPAGEEVELQVVLTKFAEYPKPEALLKQDKFLIQATAIRECIGEGQQDRITQLWKDREKVHNKRRGVYAYQEALIKCRLVVPEDRQDAPAPAEAAPVNGAKSPAKRNGAPARGDNGAHTSAGDKSQVAQLDKWKRKTQDYDKLLEYTVKLSEEKQTLEERLQKQIDRNKMLSRENEERSRRLQQFESNEVDEKLDDDAFMQTNATATQYPEITDPPIFNTIYLLLFGIIAIVFYMLGQYNTSCPDPGLSPSGGSVPRGPRGEL